MSHFTRDQRDAWAATTRDSPFNRWLKHRTTNRDGTLDLELLDAVAREYGIDPDRYSHLNAGQRRMNIGNRLRRLVPGDVLSESAPMKSIGEPKVRAAPGDTSPSPSAPRRAAWSPLAARSVRWLLRSQAEAIEELRRRGIVRTGNAPLGDYAESLFAHAMGWHLLANSNRSVDAVDRAGRRYQIKARRERFGTAGERQLGILRRLDEHCFDELAAILFSADFSVRLALLIPYPIVCRRAVHIAHVNGWRFILDDRVASLPGVRDVTARLRDASATLS